MPPVSNPHDRFWAKVNKEGPTQSHMETPCWEWTAYIRPNGYGEVGDHVRRGAVLAHRYAYREFVGPIPDGLFVCHRCDNRRCVRLDHLYIGTRAENHTDMVRKGRHSRRLTDDQVREIRRKHDAKEGTCQMLADEYGVSLGNIFDVVSYEIYRHVTKTGRSVEAAPKQKKVKRVVRFRYGHAK